MTKHKGRHLRRHSEPGADRRAASDRDPAPCMCGPRPQRLPRPRRGQRKAAGESQPSPPPGPPAAVQPSIPAAGPGRAPSATQLSAHRTRSRSNGGARGCASRRRGAEPNRSIKAPATRSRRLPAYPPSPPPTTQSPETSQEGPRCPQPSSTLHPSPPSPRGPNAVPGPTCACRRRPSAASPSPPPAVIRAEGPRLPFGAGAAGGAGSGTASVLAPRARSAPRVAAAPVRPGTYRPERKARLDGVRGERRGRPSVRAGPREAPSAAPGGGASPGINRPDFVLFGRGASLIHQSVSGCPQPELAGGFSEKPLCCPAVAYPRGWRMRRPRAAPAAGCAALRPNGRRARNRGLRAGTAGGEGPRAAPTWSRARPSWSHKMVRVGRNPPKPSGPALNGDTRGSMSAQSPPA